MPFEQELDVTLYPVFNWVLEHGPCQGSEAVRHCCARIELNNGLLPPDRIQQPLVAYHAPCIIQGDFEEAAHHLGELLEYLESLGGIPGHVDQYLEMPFIVIFRQELDEGVGISYGGRLRRHHQQNFLGSDIEIGHVLRDAALSVDDEDIEILFQRFQFVHQPQPSLLAQSGVTLHSRTGRHQPDPSRSLDDDVRQAHLSAEDVVQGVERIQSQQHVDVPQAQVGIEDQDPFPLVGKGHGQIDHHSAFAYPAFAAGDGNYPRVCPSHLLNQSGRVMQLPV